MDEQEREAIQQRINTISADIEDLKEEQAELEQRLAEEGSAD